MLATISRDNAQSNSESSVFQLFINNNKQQLSILSTMMPNVDAIPDMISWRNNNPSFRATNAWKVGGDSL